MKRLLIWLASVAVPVLGTLAVFLFNASSASRNTVITPNDQAPIIEDVEDATEKNPVTDTPTVHDPINPDDKQPSNDSAKPDLWQEFLASLAAKGVSLTLLSEPKELAFADVQRIVYSYTQNGALALTAKGEQKANLWLYEGLLLSKKGSKTYVCHSESGAQSDITGYLPVYAHAESSRAVFYQNGSFYAWNTVAKKMEKIKEPAFAGLYYDNVTAVTDELSPFWDAASGLWGYCDKDGKTVIAPSYRRAFPFGADGVAAVQKNKTSGLVFIDKQGKTVYDSRQSLYTYNGTEVYDLYALPETLTGASMGQLFFEKGYVWVVANTYAIQNSTEILRSRTLLVNKEGELLSLPEDYTVQAYSDGILVLEKNGRYGYFSCDGYWIADPIYKKAAPFAGDIGVVIDQKGTYTALDKRGKALLSLPFDYLTSISSGKMLGYRTDKGWMLFSVPVREESKTE